MTATTTASPPRLRDHLPLAVGSVALITLAAFADRAVGTALPTIVRDFDAVSAFGVVNAAPAASFLFVLSLAGAWADRSGPLAALRTGVATFALAQLLVGLAPTMTVAVAGRLLSGAAEALLDVSLMVLVAHALPSGLRPRMFSVISAAWVLPSVFGPLVTGVVTEHLGWRWVFLGLVVCVPPMWLLLRRALVSPPPGTRGERPPSYAGWSAVAAAALFALSLGGEQLADRLLVGVAIVVVATVVLGVSVVRLLPRGTLRARRGLPAVVAVRALVSAAFGGIGSFLPLLLTVLHGYRPAAAGLSLTVTGLSWAFGSWVQGRDTGLTRVQLLRVGVALLTLGMAVTTLLAVPGLWPWFGLAGWAVAGVGMGLTSSTASVLVLDLSADDEQGRNASAVNAALSSSMAVAIAFGGALVALTAPAPGAWVFAVLLGTGTLSLTLALALTRRVATSSG